MLNRVSTTVEETELVRAALEEDIGTGDVTTAATVPELAAARALITQKAPGVIYGLQSAETVFALLDPDARFERLLGEGGWRGGGGAGPAGTGAGPAGRCWRWRGARGRS